MISTGLAACGIVTGEYTSPHLVSYCERFRINDVQISKPRFAVLFSRVMAQARKVKGITEFEVLTAMVFVWFRERKVSVAVIETGLGGRFDATNVIMPLVSVITSIGYDHQSILGATLSKIAFEKGGIIKPTVPIVCGALPAEARNELQRIARGNKSQFILARKVSMHTRMRGTQQAINCGMAMSVHSVLKEHLVIPRARYERGVQQAFLEGRLQVIKRKNAAPIVLDGGHNQEASAQLVRNVRTLFAGRRCVLVLGILKRKDARAILCNVGAIADLLVLTSPGADYHTVDSLKDIAVELRPAVVVRCCARLKDAVSLAERSAQKKDLICITGSFYLLGEYLRGSRRGGHRN